MASALHFALTEVKENGELPVRGETGPEVFPDALTEGTLVGPIAVEGVIRAIDSEAAFEGVAKGRWRFECTRCLVAVEVGWNTAVSVVVPINGGPLDLTDEVRQSIALAQPMKILCRPDCRGLCPACGIDRNQTDCGHSGL